jgi:hypothetical protein
MEDPQYFFCYASIDKEFVLRLATELRAAGVNVWLDRLDILAGERWDRSIERALAHSQGLIGVLSPESLASDNVMDELSYALEEKKFVVPLLLRPCDIPFRLRRLQYADFSADYKSGLGQLLRALHLPAGPLMQGPGKPNEPEEPRLFAPPLPASIPEEEPDEPPIAQPLKTSENLRHKESIAQLYVEAEAEKTPIAEGNLLQEEEPVGEASQRSLLAPQRNRRDRVRRPRILEITPGPRALPRRLKGMLLGAAIGAVWGTIVVLLQDPKSLVENLPYAGVLGISGAITGAIGGMRLSETGIAAAGMIVGFFVSLMSTGNAFTAAIYGVSYGGVAGAVACLLFKKPR